MIDLNAAMRRYFGFSSFWPGQAKAIESLLNCQHTLVVMPTGACKFLIFQLAAMLEGSHLPLQRAALPFPHPFNENPLKLSAWLEEAAGGLTKPPNQLELF